MSAPTSAALRLIAEWAEYYDNDATVSDIPQADLKTAIRWLHERADRAAMDEQIRDALAERGVPATRQNVADVKRRMIATEYREKQEEAP